MRGAFGQFWARELAKSPELKSAYADVGKSYSAQRSFRANWAAKEFEAAEAAGLPIAAGIASSRSRSSPVCTGARSPSPARVAVSALVLAASSAPALALSRFAWARAS